MDFKRFHLLFILFFLHLSSLSYADVDSDLAKLNREFSLNIQVADFSHILDYCNKKNFRRFILPHGKKTIFNVIHYLAYSAEEETLKKLIEEFEKGLVGKERPLAGKERHIFYASLAKGLDISERFISFSNIMASNIVKKNPVVSTQFLTIKYLFELIRKENYYLLDILYGRKAPLAEKPYSSISQETQNHIANFLKDKSQFHFILKSVLGEILLDIINKKGVMTSPEHLDFSETLEAFFSYFFQLDRSSKQLDPALSTIQNSVQAGILSKPESIDIYWPFIQVAFDKLSSKIRSRPVTIPSKERLEEINKRMRDDDDEQNNENGQDEFYGRSPANFDNSLPLANSLNSLWDTLSRP